jgi:hypothetical protein
MAQHEIKSWNLSIIRNIDDVQEEIKLDGRRGSSVVSLTPSAGTQYAVDSAVPLGARIEAVYIVVTEEFTGGTNIQIGNADNAAGYATITTPAVSSTKSDADFVNAFIGSDAGDGTVTVAVNGTYTAGVGQVLIVYTDVR